MDKSVLLNALNVNVKLTSPIWPTGSSPFTAQLRIMMTVCVCVCVCVPCRLRLCVSGAPCVGVWPAPCGLPGHLSPEPAAALLSGGGERRAAAAAGVEKPTWVCCHSNYDEGGAGDNRWGRRNERQRWRYKPLPSKVRILTFLPSSATEFTARCDVVRNTFIMWHRIPVTCISLNTCYSILCMEQYDDTIATYPLRGAFCSAVPW